MFCALFLKRDLKAVNGFLHRFGKTRLLSPSGMMAATRSRRPCQMHLRLDCLTKRSDTGDFGGARKPCTPAYGTAYQSYCMLECTICEPYVCYEIRNGTILILFVLCGATYHCLVRYSEAKVVMNSSSPRAVIPSENHLANWSNCAWVRDKCKICNNGTIHRYLKFMVHLLGAYCITHLDTMLEVGTCLRILYIQ